jgi:NAD(P)-dependent dehydrogenase (short-subunit alcohol dehydrogenase family)
VHGSDSRVAVVTGAARGLGLAAARALAHRGWRVHASWRSSTAPGAELEREFPGRTWRADLSQAPECRELVRAVLGRDGRLDALVHAVGDWHGGTLAQSSAADVRRMFESNVLTAVHAFEAAREPQRAARGSALFFGVAGLEGLRARREGAAYAAAKSALLVLVRSWAQEEAAHGLRVNLLSPGLFPHPHAAAETQDAARQAAIPLGRPGRLAEIGDAAAWLLSPEAAYVTGADFPVAGGWLL